MKLLHKIVFVAVACVLIVSTFAVVAPRAVHAIVATMVQSIDEPGRAPFQVTVPIDVNNFVFTPVTIPSGQRLVIDYISLSGDAFSPGGPTQPIILLSSSVQGGPGNLYYIGPQPSTTVSTQYYHAEKATIYADSLAVGPGYAGFTPSFMGFNVTISGHLIKP